MVKRKTIGAIQLIIGMIILLIGIGGLIYSITLYSELKEEMYDLDPFWDIQSSLSTSNYTNATKQILSMEYLNLIQNKTLFKQQEVIILILFSALAIILSLLFIFRGLVNISEKKLKQREIII